MISLCARIIQTTCPAFEFLDAKDALYRQLLEYQASDAMPLTRLISYDCDSEEDIPDFAQRGTATLLKAPLGSGGDSLYFVSSKADVLSIIKAHFAKAEASPGFFDSLRQDHRGCIPAWSLQAVIPSVLLSNNRKCQVRAYVVYCNSELFLYSDYEVRQPMWVKPEDAAGDVEESIESQEVISPTLQADLDFCSKCADGARPYNLRRSKTHTERMMITEVDGMLGEESTKDKITDVMLTAFRALKPKILTESIHPLQADRDILQPKSSSPMSSTSSESFPGCLQNEEYQQNVSEMAIIGVDLIIEAGTMQPYIVEVNNNPAMPAPNKTMTVLYRQHLVEFVASLISLGVGAAEQTRARRAGKGRTGGGSGDVLASADPDAKVHSRCSRFVPIA